MESSVFGISDIRRCFPWIAHSTIQDRIELGLTPINRRGSEGEPHKFTLPEIVHIGVVDEMLTLGAIRPTKKTSDLSIEFLSHPEDQGDYSQHQPPGQWREAIYYCEFHSFHCVASVNIGHELTQPSKGSRRKTGRRVYSVRFVPLDLIALGLQHLRCRITLLGEPQVIWTSAEIRVDSIAVHCKRVLGLTKSVDLAALWKEIA